MVKALTKGVRGIFFMKYDNYVGIVFTSDTTIDKASSLFYEFKKTFFLSDVSLVATLKDNKELRSE